MKTTKITENENNKNNFFIIFSGNGRNKQKNNFSQTFQETEKKTIKITSRNLLCKLLRNLKGILKK